MATIKPLGNGKCKVSYYDELGVQQRVVLPNKQAKDLHNQLVKQTLFKKMGIELNEEAHNVGNILFKELADPYRSYLSTTRAKKNVSYVDTLVLKWGNVSLKFFNKISFREWINFALDNPVMTKNGPFQYDASSVKKFIRYGVAIFNYAIERDLLKINPLNKITDAKLRKEFKRRIDKAPIYLTEEEFWAFASWNKLPSHIKNPVVVAWCSGMRENEISQITWKMIEGDKIVFVAGQVKEAKGKPVYLEKEAVEVLQQIQIDQIAAGIDSKYVFLNTKNNPVLAHYLGTEFRKAIKAFAMESQNPKYEKIKFHNLRDSWATRKLSEGADLKAVSQNLGHSSLRTTAIYNNLDERRMREELTGKTGKASELLKDQIKLIIDVSAKNGIDVKEVIAEIRSVWRETLKNCNG